MSLLSRLFLRSVTAVLDPPQARLRRSLRAIASARLPADVNNACVEAFFAGAEVKPMQEECDYGGRHVNIDYAPTSVHEILAAAGFKPHVQDHRFWHWCEGLLTQTTPEPVAAPPAS